MDAFILFIILIMAARNRYCPNVHELYNLGLPELKFSKVFSPSSRHTSDHLPVDSFEIRNFSTLARLDNEFYHDEFQRSSMILSTTEVRKRKVSFGNESDIQFLVSMYFRDIITLSANDVMDIRRECSYTNEVGKNQRPDNWVIYVNGMPVDIIKVKSPESDIDQSLPSLPSKRAKKEDLPAATSHVLDDPRVLGQIYDHILNMQSFGGQFHVFAILTTLKDFRVVWLPRSNDYAEATTELTHESHAPLEQRAEEFMHRDLCGTEILSHTTERLTHIILSAVLKSAASPFLPVHAFSPTRMYLRLRDTGWNWHCLGDDALELLDLATLQLQSTADQCAHYTIIQSISRVPDCKVWVALAGGTKSVCVVKQMLSPALVEREVAAWHQVNGQQAVFATTVHNSAAIVMPFVVLVHVVEGRPQFNTNFKLWAVSDYATPGPVPRLVLAQLTAVSDMLAAGVVGTVMEVATAVIRNCAAAGIVHTDLQWRHFGVVPVFNNAGQITTLQPILIDFGSCETGVSTADALERMTDMLADLSHGVHL